MGWHGPRGNCGCCEECPEKKICDGEYPEKLSQFYMQHSGIQDSISGSGLWQKDYAPGAIDIDGCCLDEGQDRIEYEWEVTGLSQLNGTWRGDDDPRLPDADVCDDIFTVDFSVPRVYIEGTLTWSRREYRSYVNSGMAIGTTCEDKSHDYVESGTVKLCGRAGVVYNFSTEVAYVDIGPMYFFCQSYTGNHTDRSGPFSDCWFPLVPVKYGYMEYPGCGSGGNGCWTINGATNFGDYGCPVNYNAYTNIIFNKMRPDACVETIVPSVPVLANQHGCADVPTETCVELAEREDGAQLFETASFICPDARSNVSFTTMTRPACSEDETVTDPSVSPGCGGGPSGSTVERKKYSRSGFSTWSAQFVLQ